MGSCYSCRSNGGPATYTTVAMANVDDMKEKRKTPYTRENSGFKRKIPATMKSHSQERTSGLVNMYETKIANVGNSHTGANSLLVTGPGETQANKHSSSSVISSLSSSGSNMTRGSNKGSTNSNDTSSIMVGNERNDKLVSVSSSTNYPDGNCNNVTITTNLSTAKSLPPNKVNTLLGSPKRYPSKQTHQPGRENSPDLILATNKPGVEGVRNVNEKRLNKSCKSEDPSKPNSTKIPLMCKARLGGLPRPQVPVLVSKPTGLHSKAEVNDDRGSESDSKSLTSIEPMQISSENIPNDENLMFEGDSGIGTSMSDRKTDGDTETLAEVEQIEGDTISLSSFTKERFPEKLDAAVVNIENPSKKQAAGVHEAAQGMPSKVTKQRGIARLKNMLPNKTSQQKADPTNCGTQTLIEKVGKAATSKSQYNQAKVGQKKRQPLIGEYSKSSSEKSTPKSSPKRIARFTKEVKKEEKVVKNYTKQCDSSDEWKILTESRQKENITPDIEEVLIQPLTLTITNKVPSIPAASEIKNSQKSPRIEAALPSSIFEKKETKAKQEDFSKASKTSPMAVSSNENSFSEMGPYSPPSEKEFFLIDDEIADQPALIACQSLAPSSFLSSQLENRYIKGSRLVSKFPPAVVTDLNEEGGFPALAQQPALGIEIMRRRTQSLDTVTSPCSSLGSDDLMLDFDHTEDGAFDGCKERLSNDILKEDILSDMEILEGGDFALKRSGQPKLATVGGLLEEWSQMKTSQLAGDNSSMKYRLTRKDSTSSSTTPIGDSSEESYSRTSVHPSGSRSSVARPITSLRPPKPMNVIEANDGIARIDATSYHHLCQDITNLKTMLFRLKRVLQENGVHTADTLNPFEASTCKSGLFLNLANCDLPEGVLGAGNQDCGTESQPSVDYEQENADLRRQVVFLQQQLEERDRTVKLLQQQMTKYTTICGEIGKKDMCNAACQTERQKMLMDSSLSSSGEETAFGSTVSLPPTEQS